MKKTALFIFCLLAISTSGMSQADTVFFSMQGGFYDDVIQLELLNYYPQNHIRYTVNGNTPDVHSPVYSGTLALDSTLFSRSNIYTIVNTIPSLFYLPDDVQRAIVIRAAAFDNLGNRLCQPVTNTYFIRSLGCDFHDLPVLSITADSLSLFDYETGIFVPGINYDPADSIHTGNFKMKGREWERVVNVEFYETDNQGINQQCGLRTHGGASRWFQQKGMKLYARYEYGKKKFSFPFFSTSSINKFKHLCLHPFRCSNWLQTGGQEYLSQTIARQLDVEALAVREVVVFINGEYWGIYTLEEAPDERYIESHFDADLEKLSMIKYWGVPYYGDPTEWRNLYEWFDTADLSRPDDWNYAVAHVDLSNFVDYMLYETFSANLDWPQNNVKIWQAEPGARFRWLFYDGDGCFTRPGYDVVNHVLELEACGRLFMRFLENEDFLNLFCERYHELRASYLSYESMKTVLDEYSQFVEEEVPRQSQRFHFPITMEQFRQDLSRADDFLRQRDAYYLAELKEHFTSLAEEVQPRGDLLCYPNPTTGLVIVKDDAWQQVEVYDVFGQKATISHTDGNRTIIDLSGHPVGIYFITATDKNGQRCVKKIVKQ